MRREQRGADDLGQPHGSVETRRGDQGLELFLKNRAENEFHAGFPIAACNADLDQVRTAVQHALGILKVHFRNALFNRPCTQCRQCKPDRQQHRERHQEEDLRIRPGKQAEKAQEKNAQQKKNNGFCSDQAFDPCGHNEPFLFPLHLQAAVDCPACPGREQRAENHRHPVQAPGRENRCAQKCDHSETAARQNTFFQITAHGVRVPGKLIAFQLKEMNQPPRSQDSGCAG